MRLSGLPSKEPSREFYQVDGFLNSKLKSGKQREINSGTITLSFYCKECEDKTFIAQYPQIRVLKRSYKLFKNVCTSEDKYEKYSELLEKVNIVYNEELGSGAIVYLLKIYEQIALKQYSAFYRLIIGILDNINNNKELLKAINELELDQGGKNV